MVLPLAPSRIMCRAITSGSRWERFQPGGVWSSNDRRSLPTRSRSLWSRGPSALGRALVVASEVLVCGAVVALLVVSALPPARSPPPASTAMAAMVATRPRRRGLHRIRISPGVRRGRQPWCRLGLRAGYGFAAASIGRAGRPADQAVDAIPDAAAADPSGAVAFARPAAAGRPPTAAEQGPTRPGARRRRPPSSLHREPTEHLEPHVGALGVLHQVVRSTLRLDSSQWSWAAVIFPASRRCPARGPAGRPAPPAPPWPAGPPPRAGSGRSHRPAPPGIAPSAPRSPGRTPSARR